MQVPVLINGWSGQADCADGKRALIRGEGGARGDEGRKANAEAEEVDATMR